MLLVIVLMNLATIGTLLYFTAEVSKSRSVIIEKLIDKCTASTDNRRYDDRPRRGESELFRPPEHPPKPLDVKKEE